MCEMIDFQIGGVGKVTVGGNWLDNNGQLPLCIAKPPLRTTSVEDDESDPEIIAFARSIFEKGGETYTPLQKWFTRRPGVLVFPEYVFSSTDFPILDGLVKQSSTPLIVLAGFGAVRGSKLIALLGSGCTAGWEDGADVLVETSRYNAGWCWVHEGNGNTRCFVFLKNFLDQTYEIFAIPDLATMQSILCVQFNNLALFPLICADLICTQADGPRARIVRALSTMGMGSRAVVCALTYNTNPYSPWWRTAIDHVVDMHQQSTVLVVANQNVAKPRPEETEDRWRCLSGVFINKARMDKHKLCLPYARQVETETSSRGLIFRCPDEGIAVGEINWDPRTAASGLYVWQPIVRLQWKPSGFEQLANLVNFYEIYRYLCRRREEILQLFPAARVPIESGLATIVGATLKEDLTPRLWPELLDGPYAGNPAPSPDELHLFFSDLDRAFAVFAAMLVATGGTRPPVGLGRGQLTWTDKELRVWRSPRLKDREMLGILQKVALEGGVVAPLIVVGRGQPLGSAAPPQSIDVPAQRAAPHRRTDISYIPESGDTDDIESARQRRVYWRPMGDVEDVLLNPPQNLLSGLRNAITGTFDFN